MRDENTLDNPSLRRLAIAVLALLAGAIGAVMALPQHPVATTQTPASATDPATRVLDTAALTDMDQLIEKIADRRVVFVGETHDRYDHHLNQLAVIEGLYRRNPDLAIGLEFFQQPFQPHLDDYVAGRIDEREMLKKTEYYSRWRYDYRLYRPILRFARDHGIPLIALNVPRELTRKVATGGFAGLSDAERSMVPADIDHSDEHYRRRIEMIYQSHPKTDGRTFEHFLEAQLLWDEGMADRAARYLREHPEKSMVILAGAGHVMYGQGIPQRLQRRLDVNAVTLLNAVSGELDPALADYLLFPQRVDLPKQGLMGVMLDVEGSGVTVKGFVDDSPAKAAGLKSGDRILTLNGVTVDSYPDIRIGLMDRLPGDQVAVRVMRENLLVGDEQLDFTVTLH